MLKKIKDLTSIFSKENEKETKSISKEELDKYFQFKNWLDENGAKYKNTITFPISYGPFGIRGCKAIRNINENESIIFIPRHLMIISKDYPEISKIIDEIDFEECDYSTLILTIFLYLENKKGNNSFFYPYLQLFPKNNCFDYWDENKLNDLDDLEVKISIQDILYELDDYYSYLILNDKLKDMKRNEFSYFYFQVISRQFYIDDESSALIPLADLLNHNNVNIKYEIYDSENFIFKYTNHFGNNKILELFPTKTFDPPLNKVSYNRLMPIIIKNQNKDNNDNDKNDDDNDKNDDDDDNDNSNNILEINKNDYFTISTCSNQIFKIGDEVYNNYCEMSNEEMLKFYGFNQIDNINDFSIIYIKFVRGDKKFDDIMSILFKKKYKYTADPLYNILKLKIKFKSICIDLIRYFRMEFYKKKGNINEYFLYKFDFKIEYEIIEQCIYFLESKLKILTDQHSIESDVDYLEKNLYSTNELDYMKINAVIFRLRQKINFRTQIGLLNTIKKIMDKHQIKKYLEISEYLNELEISDEFDTKENNKKKIIKFLTKEKKLML